MVKKSAGLLMYRKVGGSVEVLLVHPGGPFWAKKDEGTWSIPKGEFGDGEEPLEAAKREFQEETGFGVDGKFEALEPVKQAGGKVVYAWAIEGDIDSSAIRSNNFSMEWPPRSKKIREFPEVDRGAWLELAMARKRILTSQNPLLDELLRKLKKKS